MNELDAVAECLRSGWLTMGPRTQAFEQALAEFTGAPHAIAVSSGTAALQLACVALRLGPGDEVIVPAFTFSATAHAVRFAGATPVLCDVVSAQAPHIDPADVERRITPRTRAVIAVHVFGHPADLTPLRALCDAHGLALIEDAAQAFGAAVGTRGTLGCFSFGAGKQLSLGAGGLVTTADDELAARVRLLRSHAMTSGTWDRHRGHASSYDVVDIGFNFRLDEPRAALGLAKLPNVPQEVERRRAAARAARDALTDGTPMFSLDGASPAVAGVLYDTPREGRRYPALHELPAFADLAAPGSLPRAEDAARRHLALDVF